MTLQLTSTHNSQLQILRKAVRSGQPTPDGLIVAEGPHLLEEAQRGSWEIERIFHTAEAGQKFSTIIGRYPAIEVSGRAFDSVSETKNTQGVVSLLRPRAWNWEEILVSQALVVVVDGIQDPGNVGTIMRSAEAFGASGILLAPGSAHVLNGKLLRAAAGSLFRLPFLEFESREEVLTRLQGAPLRLLALAGNGDTSVLDAELRDACALVVGSEGSGISPEFSAVSETLRIPTSRVESLNAAVACSIALFEAARQRNAA